MARKTTTAFTRERLLSLPRLIAFLLNAPRAGLQPELNAFFDHALQAGLTVPPTKSALCQARRQLSPEAVRALIGFSARSVVEHSDVPRWHGLRVLALDSTVLRVPAVPECAEFFGGMNTGSGSFRALARASALLDVARDCFVDAFVGSYSEDDRSLAQRHFSALGAQDLLVMDRGYPSHALFAQLAQQGVKFCARLSHSWSEAKRVLRGTVADQVCAFGSAQAPLSLRILRHALPNGTVLLLVTNVMDAGITSGDLAALYRGRWRIEECFKLIKARLQVENWSGVLPHTVEQDFYASLVRANCAAALALEADPAHACLYPPTPGAKGWRRTLNCTLVIKSLRHALPQLLLNIDVEDLVARLLARLRKPGAKELTRAGRQAPRPRHDRVRLAGFHFAYKSS